MASDRDIVGSQAQTAGAPGRDVARGSAALASLEASADCTLPVAERFVSVNGEGRAAGKLAAFIRFTGCNLECSYCDTMWANAPAAAECAERQTGASFAGAGAAGALPYRHRKAEAQTHAQHEGAHLG